MKLEDVPEILRSDSKELLEELASAAKKTTEQYFGRTIGLYTPLYISNYCENLCVYCGFHSNNMLIRKKLGPKEIKRECIALAKTGIQNILILTGGSRTQTPVVYIKDSILIAKRYFQNIAIEVYPLETKEYRELYLAGVDGVALYQETYNRERYARLHLEGEKKDYEYRFNAIERIARSGIRHISMGVLLGLSDWRKDIYALFSHLDSIWRKYPGIEYSLSFPRLTKIKDDTNSYVKVSDIDMLKIISVARLLFPRAGINLSTRESASFRERILGFGVTKMSAGSKTSVGGYAAAEKIGKGEQFQVNDKQSLSQVRSMLIKNGFDPVFTDWRGIANERI